MYPYFLASSHDIGPSFVCAQIPWQTRLAVVVLQNKKHAYFEADLVDLPEGQF